MSTHKTTADPEKILSFLKGEFSDVSEFRHIEGGEGSQAYSFDAGGKQYIVRVNKHNPRGFKKDEYAYSHYASPKLPIPRIQKIGETDGLYFCISERVPGKILNEFSREERERMLPEMFSVLDVIHAADISESEGYGKWDETGKAESAGWKEHLMNVDMYAKGGGGMPSLFDTTFLEQDFWDIAYGVFVGLVQHCPEERSLIHGDYGFNNVLSGGKNITGVIDWEVSMYGDPLFDIAWLSFWSFDVDYQAEYLKYIDARGMQMDHYADRLLCYKLYIGLGSLSFFAYSGQREKYDGSKKAIQKLLDNV